jgi:hypothetical protein
VRYCRFIATAIALQWEIEHIKIRFDSALPGEKQTLFLYYDARF